VAGILHNIGKIVIDLYFHDELKQIFDYIEDRDCLMLQAEREILGVAHPEIGAWLTQQWNLPEQITTAIRHYPAPLEAPEEHQTLPCLIHVGDVFARTKDMGWTGDAQIPSFEEKVMETLDIEKGDIPDILEQLESEMEDASVLLELSSNADGEKG